MAQADVFIEPRSRLMASVGAFWFKRRNLVFPLVFLALLVGFRPRAFAGSASWDLGLDALGFLVALAGQTLRAAVIGFAYIKRGGKDKRVYADGLVTAGLFRHCRNPLYVGNILVCLGLFVIHNNVWVYAIGMAFVLFAYGTIVAAEEAYLHARFGRTYDSYCRRVNRWLPDFRGLKRTLRSMPFNWRRLIAKEYGSTYAWLAAVVLLLAYEVLCWTSEAQRTAPLTVLAGVLALLTGAWLTARLLKKGGRLRPA